MRTKGSKSMSKLAKALMQIVSFLNPSLVIVPIFIIAMAAPLLGQTVVGTISGSGLLPHAITGQETTNKVFVANDNTENLYIHNGAALWTLLSAPTTSNMRAIHFINANEGWAVGNNGTILHTTDGGAIWSPQNSGLSDPTRGYHSVRFLDQNIGWAGGSRAVSRTINGGVSWGGLEFVSTSIFRQSLFPVSSTVAWASGGLNTLTFRYFFRYTVQGDGSMVEEFWAQPSSYPTLLQEIYFVDPDNGWAVGKSGSSGLIVRITNASSASPSFSNQPSGTSHGLSGIHMLDLNNGWAVGDNGTILTTTNGGATWTPQASGTTTNLADVYFVDLNRGWVVGDNGLIITTNDGGITWTPEPSGIAIHLDNVFFVNPGFAVGDNGVILKRPLESEIPSISITDVTVTEGNTGTVNANFTVTLSAVSSQVATVDYATADGTATAGSDYMAGSGTVTFMAGTTAQTITVEVNGDVLDEPDETFFVNLSNPTNATIADNQGQGTITDDDPPPSISINDVTVPEGNAGTVNAVFTVTLSAASGQTVTVDYATADGTAIAGSYYVAGSGTGTFPAGTTTQTMTVVVNGDVLDEPDETFFVNLSNPTNAIIEDGQGQCTIIDDDLTSVVVAQVSCLQTFIHNCPISTAIAIDLSETSPEQLLGSYHATLTWDPILLEYAGYSGGDPPFSNPIVNEDNTAAGELNFEQSDATGAGGVVIVIQVIFNVIGEPGSNGVLDLDFSELVAAVTFNNLLPITTIEDCSFTIEPGCLLGDVTGEGECTIFDALIIATYDVGLEIPPEYLDRINRGCGNVTGPVDGDTETTIFDALIIATADVGLPVAPYVVGEPHCPEY